MTCFQFKKAGGGAGEGAAPPGKKQSIVTIPALTHCSFLPSSLPPFLPSSLPPFLPSSLASLLPYFLPSFPPSLLPSFPPSLLPSFPPSFLPSFVPSSKTTEPGKKSQNTLEKISQKMGFHQEIETNAGFLTFSGLSFCWVSNLGSLTLQHYLSISLSLSLSIAICKVQLG